MAWSLDEARARRKEGAAGPPLSNQELFEAWKEYEATRIKEITLTHKTYDLGIFLSWVGDIPVASLDRADFWAYTEDYIKSPRSCRFFQTSVFGKAATECRKGLDLAGCSLECPMRQYVTPNTVRKHLKVMAGFYRFLLRHGYVASNLMTDVADEWWEENKHREEARIYRRFTTEEAEALVRFTRQPNRKIALAVLFLTGIRCSELLRLRTGPKWLNLQEGWIKVPKVPQQKRRGEDKLWITPDLLRALRVYLEWWDKNVQRDQKGRPTTNHFLLTARGTPWTSYNSFKRAWGEQCVRAGVLDGSEDEFTTLTPHDTRHWITTQLTKAKAPDYYIALYRGDKRGVVADTYTHLTDQDKRQEFLRYAPRLNV